MPIFEYQCEACETTFERLLLRPQNESRMTCPQCGSQRTEKIFSTFSTTVTGHGVATGGAGNPAFT